MSTMASESEVDKFVRRMEARNTSQPVLGKLVCFEAGEKVFEFLLSNRPCMVGCATHANIRIHHPDIAEEHCQVSVDGDGNMRLFHVTGDHQTKVNGQSVTTNQKLVHNDVITVASIQLVYVNMGQTTEEPSTAGVGETGGVEPENQEESVMDAEPEEHAPLQETQDEGEDKREWNDEILEMLLDMFEESEVLLRGTFKGTKVTSKVQLAHWQKIADSINANFPNFNVDGKAVRSKKGDWFYRTRSKKSRITNNLNSTGCGPYRGQPLTPLEERVLALQGDLKIKGIAGGAKSTLTAPPPKRKTLGPRAQKHAATSSASCGLAALGQGAQNHAAFSSALCGLAGQRAQKPAAITTASASVSALGGLAGKSTVVPLPDVATEANAAASINANDVVAEACAGEDDAVAKADASTSKKRPPRLRETKASPEDSSISAERATVASIKKRRHNEPEVLSDLASRQIQMQRSMSNIELAMDVNNRHLESLVEAVKESNRLLGFVALVAQNQLVASGHVVLSCLRFSHSSTFVSYWPSHPMMSN